MPSYELDDGVTNHASLSDPAEPRVNNVSDNQYIDTRQPVDDILTVPVQLQLNNKDRIMVIRFDNNVEYKLHVVDEHIDKLHKHANDALCMSDNEVDIAEVEERQDDNNKQHKTDNDNNNKEHTIDIKDNKDSSTKSVITVKQDSSADDSSKQRYTLRHYIIKYAGHPEGKRPAMIAVDEGVWAFIASFIGIAVVCLINFNAFWMGLHDTHLSMVIGSFGASAVLLYSAIQSDLSQPRNVIGGHIFAAIVGCIIQYIPNNGYDLIWVKGALAVSIAITVMNITKTLHPPAGATALIAILPSPTVQPIGM